MKWLILAAVAASSPTNGPNAAQFAAALAAACPTPRAATRNVDCERTDVASVQFTCRYEMQGADGRWTAHQAVLQQAEGEWVWIDGPTRCDDEDAELN
jgi:hypothetical protein